MNHPNINKRVYTAITDPLLHPLISKLTLKSLHRLRTMDNERLHPYTPSPSLARNFPIIPFHHEIPRTPEREVDVHKPHEDLKSFHSLTKRMAAIVQEKIDTPLTTEKRLRENNAAKPRSSIKFSIFKLLFC